MNDNSLLSVPVGGKAVVASLDAAGLSRRRLLDLGLTPGSCVTCLFEAPSGNPRAYLIRGVVIALRNRDAAEVTLALPS